MTNEDEILKNLQEQLNKQMAELNSAPNPEMDNLSPNDMTNILYATFTEASPIQLKKDIGEEVFYQIPFLKLVRKFLMIVKEAGEMKLTQRGFLPRKVCFALYGTGIIKEEYIETGFTKLNKEQDSMVLQNIHILSKLAGFIKKKYNKISLTAKGKKILSAKSSMIFFKELFLINYQKFNLGYHDGYPHETGIQTTFGYTMYLLLQYGDQIRNLDFYVEKNIAAFPHIIHDFEGNHLFSKEDNYKSCYWIRVFIRFLDFYGVINPKTTGLKNTHKQKKEVSTTPLFRQIFELKKANFTFKKSGFQA